MNKFKTIFIGTSSFGLSCFRAFVDDPAFEIVLVITQPDRPAGRKQILSSSPVKIEAEQHDLDVLQPQIIMDIREKIGLLKPDLIVTIAYSQILPPAILEIPKFGCLNLHASLLPKYRGAAIIPAAILNGDKKTGVTVIKMDAGLDTGPILAQKSLDVSPEDTAGTLYEKLALASPDFLIEAIKKYLAGKIESKPQDESQASYAKALTKADGLINWTKPAAELERFIRAMNPWPMAWSWWQGKQLKIISAQTEPIEINSYKPGKTFKYNNGLAVQCGRDSLIVKQLQLEGKNPLASEEFLRGQKDFMGAVLA